MASAKKVEARVRALREQALSAVSSGKINKALELYLKLADLEPSEGEWPRRIADCYWHLKEPKKRLEYAVIAANAYSEAGLLLKAIAMCKVALSIDPTHTEIQEKLAEIHDRQPKPAAATTAKREPAPAARPAVKRLGKVQLKKRALPRAALVEETGGAEDRNAKRTKKARARQAAAAALREIRARRKQSEERRQGAKRTPPTVDGPAPIAKTPGADERPAQASPPDSPAEGQPREAGSPKREVAAAKAAQAHATRGEETRHEYKRPAHFKTPIPREDPASSNPKAPSVRAPEMPPPEKKAQPSILLPQPNASSSPEVEPKSAPAPRIVSPTGVTIPRVSAFSLDRRPSQKPPLHSISLSEHVPVETRDSIAPARGNIYSLTLEDVPSNELRAAKLPDIAPLAPSAPPEIPAKKSGESVAVKGDGAAPTLEPPSEPPTFAEAAFAKVPLLSQLDSDVLSELIRQVDLVELHEHEVLFSEGDIADAMYVVVEGCVVALAHHEGHPPIELARLEEGEFFGEIGLLSDQPRQAGVSAAENSRLLRFSRDTVAALIEHNADFLSVLLQFLRDRLVEDLMLTSPLFLPLDDTERLDLSDEFEFLEIEPESLLLSPGQHPIGMYVLLTGEAMAAEPGGIKGLRHLGPGDIFGQRALLLNEPAEIEVRTASKCFAICLPSDQFREVIMTHPTVLEYVSSLSDQEMKHDSVAPHGLGDHVTLF